MQKHETKQCKRCGASFECKTGSITECQCYSVKLSREEGEYVAEQFEDCLCAACLHELKDEFKAKQKVDLKT
ncbi:cysteine-rich CWC family protein [Limibacter armeniacum]|uniref:cysteine-rich CWC family protein n=1 Tax=Limibacter armeniacum TaxID=466084 RepID=UPI0038CC0723